MNWIKSLFKKRTFDQNNQSKDTPVFDQNKEESIDDLFDKILIEGGLSSEEQEIVNIHLEKLVKKGESVIPLIKDKIDSLFKLAKVHYYSRAADLCETIGKIGGQSAFDTLLDVLNFQTQYWEYETIRAGAIMGFGHLGDNRAIRYLKEFQEKSSTSDYATRALNKALRKLEKKEIDVTNKNQNEKKPLKTEERDLEKQPSESFKDKRDGKVYKVVKIGNQVWMAENLNYDAGDGCWFYGNDPKNGEKFGRLYDFQTANKVVPSGWHLPTQSEWEALFEFLGGDDFSLEGGSFLRMKEGGDSGFNANVGGWRDCQGKFCGFSGMSGYWSSTRGSNGLFFCKISQNYATMDDYFMDNGFYVRCIKD